jgi:hypothetical protein
MRPQYPAGEDKYEQLPNAGITPGSSFSGISAPLASAPYSGSCPDTYESNLGDELALDTLFSQDTAATYPDSSSFPAFFEQVMFPSVEMVNSSHEPQQPRGVFDFMLDTDFGLSEDDLFDTDFIADLDRILDNTALVPGLEDRQNKQLDNHESASRRVAAFQRSFWYVFCRRHGCFI